LAINLKKFETLPGKLNELVQELGLNEEAERKILEQYKRKLHYIKKVSRRQFERKYKNFKARPYLLILAILLLALAVLHPGVASFAGVFVAAALLVVTSKHVCWYIYWKFEPAKPSYPHDKLRDIKMNREAIKQETRQFQQGFSGEALVAQKLERELSNHFYLINDITLHQGQGTIQIDHVVIGPPGVIAIETKNITGNYYPDPEGGLRYPAHTIDGIPVRNYKRTVIPNPQEQSRSQAQALAAFFDKKSIRTRIYNLVVLTHPRCRFNGKSRSDAPPVLYLKDLCNYICSLKPRVLDDMQIREIVKALLQK
jgi:hypothetical protein